MISEHTGITARMVGNENIGLFMPNIISPKELFDISGKTYEYFRGMDFVQGKLGPNVTVSGIVPTEMPGLVKYNKRSGNYIILHEMAGATLDNPTLWAIWDDEITYDFIPGSNGAEYIFKMRDGSELALTVGEEFPGYAGVTFNGKWLDGEESSEIVPATSNEWLEVKKVNGVVSEYGVHYFVKYKHGTV